MEQEKQPVNHFDFQHGYSSGVEGVTRDTYEGYLSSQVNHEWLTERIQEKQDELQQLERQVGETIASRKSAYNQLQEHILKLSVQSRRVDRLEKDRNTIEQEQETLRERRAKASPDYSLLAGLLFLVAGVSFLAGDLIISHEIVAYALNIRNNTEAWAFAVGLAMVSILLKPAYDRLIEKPYLENPEHNRTKYERFKIALAIFSVITLAILGWFRYEAYRTDQMKSAINKSIRQMQLNGAPVDPTTGVQQYDPALLNKIEKQLQDSDALNQTLVSSPFALLSFVLSGILFALAGAVCLGIALPVLQAFWFRWLQADIRLWKLRRRMKRVVRELTPAEQELAVQITRKNVLEHELELLPNLDALQKQKQVLTGELNQLQEESKLARADSRIANYNDGFSKGEVARNAMTDEEYQQFRSGYFTTQNLANRAKSNSSERSVTMNSSRSRGLRPYQAIRKFIADDFEQGEREE